MKTILILIMMTLISCDTKISKDIPIDTIERSTENELERKVKSLGEQIESLDIEKVTKRLGEQDSIRFLNRIKDLKQSYNSSIGLLKKKYSAEDLRTLETEYIKTIEIWDYIIRNYKI